MTKIYLGTKKEDEVIDVEMNDALKMASVIVHHGKPYVYAYDLHGEDAIQFVPCNVYSFDLQNAVNEALNNSLHNGGDFNKSYEDIAIDMQTYDWDTENKFNIRNHIELTPYIKVWKDKQDERK